MKGSVSERVSEGRTETGSEGGRKYGREGGKEEVANQTCYLTQSQLLTLDQPVPALTLYHQVPGRAVTGASIVKSLGSQDPGKSQLHKRNRAHV